MDTQKKEVDFETFLMALFAKIYELRPNRPIVFNKLNKPIHEFFVENAETINTLLCPKAILLIDNSGYYPTISQIYETFDGWCLAGVLGSMQKVYSYRLTQEYCLIEVPHEYYVKNGQLLEELAKKFILALMRP
jgi:hypothetical protein